MILPHAGRRARPGAVVRWLVVVAAALGPVMTLVACSGGGSDGTTGEDTTGGDTTGGDDMSAGLDPDAVAAAETLCPVLWTWVTDVGSSFNTTARAVVDIDDVEARRDRWAEGLDRIDDLVDRLGRDVAPWEADPILAPLVAEIERDLPRARSEVDDIRLLFTEFPEVDDGPPQNRTSQVIVRIEKVVDLPKPDLIPNDPDGDLLPAFRSVPACQHAVRDVDDGTPQANG